MDCFAVTLFCPLLKSLHIYVHRYVTFILSFTFKRCLHQKGIVAIADRTLPQTDRVLWKKELPVGHGARKNHTNISQNRRLARKVSFLKHGVLDVHPPVPLSAQCCADTNARQDADRTLCFSDMPGNIHNDKPTESRGITRPMIDDNATGIIRLSTLWLNLAAPLSAPEGRTELLRSAFSDFTCIIVTESQWNLCFRNSSVSLHVPDTVLPNFSFPFIQTCYFNIF